MKINEVEALVGITKKNIRFYEEQGLLKPGRNSQNGYREYGEPEVELLRQIKLLRKLGVPLEEIRQMQTGSRTLGDGMRRHLVTLERERKNLDQAVQFCQALKDREVRLDSLDAGGLLREMEQMEQEGATFLDRQQGDTRRIRYVAPVVVTLLTVFLMGGADRPDAVGLLHRCGGCAPAAPAGGAGGYPGRGDPGGPAGYDPAISGDRERRGGGCEAILTENPAGWPRSWRRWAPFWWCSSW